MVPKGKIFSLASGYKKHCRKNKIQPPHTPSRPDKKPQSGKHYDDDSPISLSYSRVHYGMPKKFYNEAKSLVPKTALPEAMEDFFVEPFDQKADKFEAQYHKQKEENDLSKDQVGNYPPETETPKPIQNVAAPASDNQKQTPQKDDDFMSDLKDIIQGKKRFDADSKKMVKNAEDNNIASQIKSPQKQVQKTKNPSPEEELKNKMKNEHEIFEKISQSMKYANSYDLGAFQIADRLEVFDKEMDQEVNKKQSTPAEKKAPNPIASPKDEPQQKISPKEAPKLEKAEPKLTTADFIKDLDDIKKLEKELIKQEEKLVEQKAATTDWCAMRTAIVQTAKDAENNDWTNSAGVKIKEGSMKSKIKEYFEVVKKFISWINPDDAADKASKDDPNWAWSAPFINWVMDQAGVKPEHGFEFGLRHLGYMIAAMRNRENGATDRPFWFYGMDEQDQAPAAIGDLLCYNRSSSTLDYQQLYDKYYKDENLKIPASSAKGNTHCNIVVGRVTRNGKHYLQTIGGNESDTVMLREHIETDSNGTILNPSSHRLFGVIKLLECQNDPFLA